MTDLPIEDRQFAVITEDSLNQLRRLIGVPITDSLEPWVSEITKDSIRHYAHGIGDDNPLWCDPSYAATTKYGGLLAPPSFVFPLNRILSGYVGGIPGVHAMWAGADLTWYEPLRRGMSIETHAHLKDLISHETRFAGRSIQQIYHVDYRDEAGTLLANGDSWCFRTERDAARELGTKYDEARENRRELRYSAEDIQAVFDLYAAEKRRGGETRYVEDVTLGEELGVMPKGPMTVTGFIAYAQGWGGLYIRANRLAYQQLKKHPGLGIPNEFGIPDVPERVHWDTDLATLVGTPAAYDYGPERCSWLMHHLTDWMGDDGFLRRHQSRIRRHNPVGEWITIHGTVTGIDGDEVEITQEARNNFGDLSATGTGVVRLPRRG